MRQNSLPDYEQLVQQRATSPLVVMEAHPYHSVLPYLKVRCGISWKKKEVVFTFSFTHQNTLCVCLSSNKGVECISILIKHLLWQSISNATLFTFILSSLRSSSPLTLLVYCCISCYHHLISGIVLMSLLVSSMNHLSLHCAAFLENMRLFIPDISLHLWWWDHKWTPCVSQFTLGINLPLEWPTCGRISLLTSANKHVHQWYKRTCCFLHKEINDSMCYNY